MRRLGIALLALILLVGPSMADSGVGALPWRAVGPRAIVDSRGAPVFVNAEAAWSLVVALKPDAALLYLNDRHRRGFNALVVNLIEHKFSGPRNALGALPFTGRPFEHPSEEYFRHVDWLLTAAEERGIVLILAPAYVGWLCGDHGWCEELKYTDVATARAYGRYLGDRYRQRPNIIWLEGGDADARRWGVMPQIFAIANGIREGAPEHLHTAHCYRYTLGSDCYPWSWIQIESIYGDCDTIASLTRRAHAGQRPAIVIEARYEGEGADARCLRGQLYAAALAGASGHVFGNHWVWPFEPSWQARLDSAGARDVAWGVELLRALRWWELSPPSKPQAPDGPVSMSGSWSPKSRETAVVSESADARRLVVYVPSGRTLTLRQAPTEDPWCAAWIDPDTRQTMPAGGPATRGSLTLSYQGQTDRLLVAQRCRIPRVQD